MVRRIIFDLDDTLLRTGVCFRDQLKEFAEKVHTTLPLPDDHGPSEILDHQRRVNIDLYEKHGFSNDHFPRSLVHTWISYCRETDRPVYAAELEECRRIGWRVFERIPEPIPEMESVLDELQSEYELVLYTMGDPEIQRRKIRHFNLEQWFSLLHIIPDKTDFDLNRVVAPLPVHQVAIVGDSLRNEIKPGLDLGLHTIHCQPGHDLSYPEQDLEEEVPSIQSLSEVFDHLP